MLKTVENELQNDVKITVLNNTSKVDFTLCVFARNDSVNAVDCPFIVWHTIKTQSKAEFIYPVKMGVGARFRTWQGIYNQCGPFEAKAGSTWEVSQRQNDGVVIMTEKSTAPLNPDDIVLIKNLKPRTWEGRQMDLGVYKGANMLLVQRDVGAGSQAMFYINPILYFGVMKSVRVGDSFHSFSNLQKYFKVNLNDYSSGLKVILEREETTGKFVFKAKHPEEDADT